MEGVKVPNSLLPPYIFQMIESQTIWSIEPTQDLISVYWFSWCLRRWQHIQQGWIHEPATRHETHLSFVWIVTSVRLQLLHLRRRELDRSF
ncbi:hypothetical protein C6341_g10066 [Phytophthora cactorum]|nr:hypothetical protein C6341_g10066 [Phytophthora cactorum]